MNMEHDEDVIRTVLYPICKRAKLNLNDVHQVVSS